MRRVPGGTAPLTKHQRRIMPLGAQALRRLSVDGGRLGRMKKWMLLAAALPVVALLGLCWWRWRLPCSVNRR